MNGPLGRILPTTPPTPPSAPIQKGAADGFAVVAGHNGDVQFTEITNTPALQRHVGHSVIYSCFRLTREFGIFTARGLGNEARFTPKVGFDVNGVGTPFDGCDIEGSAGHLWPDKNGSHSVVEIAFTTAGRNFFADRAAARDLALFVRASEPCGEQAVEHAFAEPLREFGGDAVAEHLLDQAVARRHAAGDGEMRR